MLSQIRHANPLIAETLTGFGASGRVHLDYFNYLMLQAVVLFIWWPKSTLIGWLENQTSPNTLLAVLIAVGISIAYYSLRAGAEELMFPTQHSLWDWINATELKLGRILWGYLGAHLLLSLHAIMLSSPLLLMAYAVAGSEWSGLAWAVIAILLQALYFRLLGAIMYLLIGHYEHLIFLALRAALVAGYLLIGMLLPVAGSVLGFVQEPLDSTLVRPKDFILLSALLGALLAWVLYWVLARRRRLISSSDLNDMGRK